MVKIAGRLRHFIEAWSRITSDKFILNSISGYKITFHKPPVQLKMVGNTSLNSQDDPHLQEVIDNLLRVGAIQQCIPSESQILSSYFLVPKTNGKFRFVLTLKDLNRFIKTDHFKMEDIRTVLKLMTKGCFMATLDLRKPTFLFR